MSRYVKTLENGKTVAYGFDHALGYFFDVIAEDSDDGEEVMLIEESSLFTRMNNGRMLELMKDHNCSEEHMSCVAMDFPIP